MANARALDKRRKSIKNIRKITRTMELIATARFQESHGNELKRRRPIPIRSPRSSVVLRLPAWDVEHPLLDQRDEVKSARMLVLASNRGLCGGYNAAILREALPRIRELQDSTPEFHADASGKRGIDGLRFRGIETDQQFRQFEDQPAYAEVEKIAEDYLARYITGEIDRLDVTYTKFISTSRQIAKTETLLPLGSLGEDASQETADEGNRELRVPSVG